MGGVFNEVASFHPRGSADVAPYYKVDGVPSAMAKMIVLDHWPNAVTVQGYQRYGFHIGIRGEVPPVHVRWNTSIMFFINLLQTSWWDDEYARKGPRAVQSRKVTGFRYQPDARGACKAYEESEGDADGEAEETINTVPDGYLVTAEGLIFRQPCRRCLLSPQSPLIECHHWYA